MAKLNNKRATISTTVTVHDVPETSEQTTTQKISYVDENKNIVSALEKRKEMQRSLRQRSNRYRLPSTFLADRPKLKRKLPPGNFKEFSTARSRKLAEQYRASVKKYQPQKEKKEVVSKEIQLANCYGLYEEENYEEALPLISSVVDTADGLRTAESYFLYGQILQKKNMLEDAIDTYTRSLELDPLFSIVYFNRGECYIALEEYDMASHEIEKFMKLETPTVDSLISLGKCKASTNELEAALQYFTEAIELNRKENNPDDAYFFFVRGDVYQRMGEDDNARRDFDMIPAVDPQFVRDYEQSAFECEERNDQGSALSIYQSLLKIEPMNSLYYLRSGIIYFNLGEQMERAVEMFNKFEETAPEEGSAGDKSLVYYTRGFIYFKYLTDWKAAISDFTSCINLGQAESLDARKLRAKCLESYPDLKAAAFADYKFILSSGDTYGPAYRFMFTYMFRNDTNIEDGKLEEAYNLFVVAYKERAIQSAELNEKLEMTWAVPDSQPSTSMSNYTNEPVAEDIQASQDVKEELTIRDMIGNVIVRLFVRNALAIRTKEEEGMNPKQVQQKRAAETKKKQLPGTLCEMAIEAYQAKFNAASGKNGRVVEGMRDVWRMYQTEFGKVTPTSVATSGRASRTSQLSKNPA